MNWCWVLVVRGAVLLNHVAVCCIVYMLWVQRASYWMHMVLVSPHCTRSQCPIPEMWMCSGTHTTTFHGQPRQEDTRGASLAIYVATAHFFVARHAALCALQQNVHFKLCVVRIHRITIYNVQSQRTLGALYLCGDGYCGKIESSRAPRVCIYSIVHCTYSR